MVTIVNEIEQIAAHQGIDPAQLSEAIKVLAPHLENYAELAITENGMEIISGGLNIADELADVGLQWGASPLTVESFIACAADFPGRMLGLKLCLGPDSGAPTLYVRTKIHMTDGLSFMAKIMPSVAAPLGKALSSVQVLYGLGFTSYNGDIAVKTYTLEEDGFLSLRAYRGTVIPEHKRYLPEVPWEQVEVPNANWREILALGKNLGYETAGHVGWTLSPGHKPELKLYIERIGAIATDYSAR